MLKFKFSALSPFVQARFKLTLWYVVILAALIIIFTMLVINARESSFLRVYRVVEAGAESQQQLVEFKERFDYFNTTFEQRLFIFDGVVFVLGAVASYFLSGRTLTQIQQMFREQEEFSADVSHELRTPLTTMSLTVDNLVRSKKGMGAEYKTALYSIREEVEHMTAIIEGLLILVRIRNPHTQDSYQRLEVAAIAQAAVEKRLSQAEQKGQQIRAVITKEPMVVMGYTEQLQQVCLILLDNAIKYSPAKAKITIRVDGDKSQAMISVTNPGKGIGKRESRDVFRRFYRGKQAGKIKGSGLGLAIAKKIIDHHGGSIRVKSEMGKETTFVVRLPLHFDS